MKSNAKQIELRTQLLSTIDQEIIKEKNIVINTFLENFNFFIESQNGIKKLRELILLLAVRGQLGTQNLKDKNAYELVKSIKEKKQKLVNERIIGKQLELSPINDNEVPFQVPMSWNWVKLGEITNILRGASPRPKGDPKYFSNERTQYHWIKISDITQFISKDGKLTDTSEFLTEEGAKHSVFVDENDIILAVSGSVGKVCMLDINGYIYDGLLTIKNIPKEINKEYLFIFLQTIEMQLQTVATGTSWSNINTKIVKNILFPIPPLEEQKQIVQVVNRLMKICDDFDNQINKKQNACYKANSAIINRMLVSEHLECFNKHRQMIYDNFDVLYNNVDNVEKLRQAILQLAITGKLGTQNENDEHSILLLEKIITKKEYLMKNKVIEKSNIFKKHIENDKTLVIPNNWSWTYLSNICAKIGSGSTPKGGKAVYESTGVKFIRSQNVWNDGLYTNGIAYIPEKINEQMNGTIVKPYDILLNITGASIGRCCLVPDNFDIGNVSQHVTIIRLIDSDLKDYLHYCLLSPYIQNLIMSSQVGISREGLSKTRLEIFLIPIPPLEEQKRIVQKVDQLMEMCDQLEDKILQSQSKIQKYVDSTVIKIISNL